MDDETRAAFDRVERWFELGQKQHVELRESIDARFARVDQSFANVEQSFDTVEQSFARVEQSIAGLREEFRAFRDWVVAQLTELRALIKQLTVRVERLERQRN